MIVVVLSAGFERAKAVQLLYAKILLRHQLPNFFGETKKLKVQTKILPSLPANPYAAAKSHAHWSIDVRR